MDIYIINRDVYLLRVILANFFAIYCMIIGFSVINFFVKILIIKNISFYVNIILYWNLNENIDIYFKLFG